MSTNSNKLWVCIYLSVVTLEAWHLGCTPTFLWKGTNLLQVARNQNLGWLFTLRDFYFFSVKSRPSFWLWHMGAVPPAPNVLQDPYLIMSACLSPRPRGPLFCTHICVLIGQWVTITQPARPALLYWLSDPVLTPLNSPLLNNDSLYER